jgi:hypothetical protein
LYSYFRNLDCPSNKDLWFQKSSFLGVPGHLTSLHPLQTVLGGKAMHPKWISWIWILAVVAAAGAQDNTGSTTQDAPVLKTRPHDSQRSLTPPDFQPQQSQSGAQNPAPVYGASPDAIPQGTRFVLGLQDPLDTHNLTQGQHFTAELRDNLSTPSGLVLPRGCAVRGHVATFEHGFMGARLMLAMDEIDTGHGWVPLVATFTGVPGDPSIKSTGLEGEITQRGPDKKRLIANAAIGAGVGAATGAAAGGGKGALAGAVAGAGLGTASSFLMKGSDIKLDKGTNLEVRLDRDLVISTP